MTCRTDCGRCIYCTEHDDYGPAWRNPRFQAATSTLGGHAGTESDVGGESSPVDVEVSRRPSAPVLGQEGGEPVDLLAALARSIEKAKAARRDGGER